MLSVLSRYVLQEVRAQVDFIKWRLHLRLLLFGILLKTSADRSAFFNELFLHQLSSPLSVILGESDYVKPEFVIVHVNFLLNLRKILVNSRRDAFSCDLRWVFVMLCKRYMKILRYHHLRRCVLASLVRRDPLPCCLLLHRVCYMQRGADLEARPVHKHRQLGSPL